MEDRLASGFKCLCGNYHKFSSYVYAHWDVELVCTCENCKRRYELFAGNVNLIDILRDPNISSSAPLSADEVRSTEKPNESEIKE